MRNLRKTCNDNGENLLFQTIADPLENVTPVPCHTTKVFRSIGSFMTPSLPALKDD